MLGRLTEHDVCGVHASERVFVGTVKAVELHQGPTITDWNIPRSVAEITFEVERAVWGVDAGPIVERRSQNSSAHANLSELGARYLLGQRRGRGGVWRTVAHAELDAGMELPHVGALRSMLAEVGDTRCAPRARTMAEARRIVDQG